MSSTPLEFDSRVAAKNLVARASAKNGYYRIRCEVRDCPAWVDSDNIKFWPTPKPFRICPNCIKRKGSLAMPKEVTSL